MSKPVVVIALSVVGAFIAIALWLICRSPEGHEDRRGFRLGSGRDPAEPENEAKTAGPERAEPPISPVVPRQ